MDPLVKQIRELRIIKHGQVGLSHAGKSDFYADVKKTFGEPHIHNHICDRLHKMIDPELHVNVVAGSGHGGEPPATGLSLKFGYKLSLVRKELKLHGLQQMIDGYQPHRTDRVAIIEDVPTTGKTSGRVVEVIMETGATVVGVYAIVKRRDINLPVPVKYLIDVKELL